MYYSIQTLSFHTLSLPCCTLDTEVHSWEIFWYTMNNLQKVIICESTMHTLAIRQKLTDLQTNKLRIYDWLITYNFITCNILSKTISNKSWNIVSRLEKNLLGRKIRYPWWLFFRDEKGGGKEGLCPRGT